MSQEILEQLLVIAVLSIGMGIVFKFTVKRPHLYWAVACTILALLSALLVRSGSIYLIVCGAFLNLIFGLLFIRILMAGSIRERRPLYDDGTPKNNESLSRPRWIGRLRALSHKYPRAINFLSGLSVGFAPAFFVLILTIVIFGSKLDPSRDFVRPEPGAAAPAFFGDITRSAVVRLYVIFGILTLAVTFIFGLAFPKQGIPIGLSTGLWVGLFVICLRMVEPVPAGISLAAICILCGYLGANFSLWVCNIVGRLMRSA